MLNFSTKKNSSSKTSKIFYLLIASSEKNIMPFMK